MRKYIIFAGYAGLFGCVKLIETHYEELGKYLNKEYLDNLKVHVENNGYYGRYLSPIYNERRLEEPVDIKATGFSDIFDVGEGGILKTLYELAGKRSGFQIEIKKINVIQICIEICEYFGLNIYRLLSKGKIILSEDPLETEKVLRESNVSCSVIGFMTENPDKIIVDKDAVEYVNRPAADEIFKVVGYEREDIICD